MNRNLLALFVIILAILVYPFFIKSLQEDTTDLRSDIETLETTIEEVENFIEIKNKLVRKSEQLSQSDLEKLTKMLPEVVNSVQIIIDLEDLALRNGLIISGGIGMRESKASSDSNGDDGLFDEINFSFSMTGEYDSLLSFLSTLADSNVIFDVRSLSFAESETGVYEYALDLRTYRLSERFLDQKI